jgi:hypothetical protein
MSIIEPNNPLTWNKPGWFSNSCYANSSLWAILYNNNYYPTIENIDKNGITEEQNKIINGLTNFHDNIINNNNNNNKINFKDFYDNSTLTIREQIAESTKDKKPEDDNGNYWLTGSASPYHFLDEIQQILKPLLTDDGVLFQYQPLGVDETLENNSDNIIQITNTSNNIKVGENLIIQYSIIQNYPIDKYFRIGQYELYAFLYYPGGIHYSCFFSLLNHSNELIWYKFDDYINSNQGSIELVGDISKIDNTLFFFQTTLFFYKKNIALSLSDNELCSTKFNYQIQYIQEKSQEALKIAQTAPTPESKTGLIKKTSSSSSSRAQSFKQTQNPKTNNSSVQVANKCEQYEQEWLDLFIEENDAKGYKTEIKTTNDGTQIEVTDRNGFKTSVLKTDKSCTFVPPGSSTDEEEIITVEEKQSEITVDELAETKKGLLQAINIILNQESYDLNNEIIIKTRQLNDFNETLIKIQNTETDETEKEKEIQKKLINIGEYIKILNILNDSDIIDDKKNDFVILKRQFNELKTNLENDEYLQNLIFEINLKLQASQDIQKKNKNKINTANGSPLLNYLNNQAVYDVNNISIDDITNIDLKKYKNKNIIIYKKNGNKPKYYMVFTDNDGKKLVNLKNNQILIGKGLDGNTNIRDSKSSKFDGGTRRRNIKFEKGKTRKFIRYKNKLKTNKLKTNKLKTNKLKTNKLKTNKLKTNKLRKT